MAAPWFACDEAKGGLLATGSRLVNALFDALVCACDQVARRRRLPVEAQLPCALNRIPRHNAIRARPTIAIRGGGHSIAGHCIGDSSVVLDLRLMHDAVVDREARIATCGGGSLWEDFDPPCRRYGLATPGGTFGDTGVAGLTLGGGIGHLIGLHARTRS
jgi:FAD/FMN-containing dehydrogenase